jgi:acyl-CoA dehydrogenase
VQLVLTEDQELIQKTALDFIEEKSPIRRMRELRDKQDPVRFSKALWKEMAELGWLGIAFPESVGGSGLGLAELAVVLEAAGRALAPEPFLSTLLLGGQSVLLGGTEAQRKEWLPAVVEGDRFLALAYQEPKSRYDLHRVATRAEPSGDGWRISGQKVHVLDGHVADAIAVVARTAGAEGDRDGIGLFLVPGNAPGLTREPQTRLDSRGAANIAFDNVELSADAVLGDPQGGADLLERVIDRATVGLCAEMLGGMSAAFELGIDYLKERDQFGVRIGTFQALKHRAARMFIEIELVRSSVMAAARAIDADDPEAAKLVSLAKARCSDTYVHVANEGVQFFAGVGMTDEYDIGLFLKRARAAELTFGDAAFHRDRWASLAGY